MKLTVYIAVIFTLILASLIILPINPDGSNIIFLFFGNFHPLVLHIPIGALIGVFVLEIVNLIKPQLNLDNGSKILLWFSAISAIPAVVFGFFLASSGGYNAEVLSYHKWLGLVTALLCVWLLVFRLWAYSKSKRMVQVYQFLLLVNIVLLSFAGHYGGSLTHGANYLTKDMPSSMKSFLGVEATEAERIASSLKEQPEGTMPQLALTFVDTIQPLMTTYCIECHNENKQKGDLRLDVLSWDMKNVEHVKNWRTALEEVTEGNMPPEDEKQPTEHERKSIIDWITNSLEGINPEVLEQELKLAQEEKEEAEAQLAMTLPKIKSDAKVSKAALKYVNDIQPILSKYCYQCHDANKQKGDMRLDILNWDMVHGGDAEKWDSALDEINAGQMPPKKKAQLTAEERRMVVEWITNSLDHAADAKSATNKEVTRRLTKSQYTNTLNQLLNLPINFGNVLPDDGKSKMGFTNNGDILQISSLHIDYYQKIAREALDEAIVTGNKPESKKYRVTFGKDIGVGKEAAEYGGYQSAAINKENFTVDILGENNVNIDVNDTIKKLIGVDMRGSASDRYNIENNGLVLYSALPHRDVPPKSWQGPSPNAKILIKNNYPKSGSFRLKVEASKGNAITLREGLIELRENNPAVITSETISLFAKNATNRSNLSIKDSLYLKPVQIDENSSARFNKVAIPSDGFYQVDFVHPYVAQENMPSFLLQIGKFNKIQERLKLPIEEENNNQIVTPVTLAYLKKGKYRFRIGGDFFVGFSEIRITPLAENGELSTLLKNEAEKNQEKYKDLIPSMRAFIGTRTDDGMDYSTFGATKEVTSDVGDFKTFEFTGRLENLPVPVFDPIEKEKFANTMIVGLWNNHLVKNKGENGPSLLVKSMELEAPYYPVWPPESHTSIFFDSPNKQNFEVYTAEVLKNFMEKAFRRPLIEGELARYMEFWNAIKNDFDIYEDSVKEVLVAILCSPNFLYLLESEHAPKENTIDEYFLASKMAYFLWNSPPDDTLSKLASEGKLNSNISSEITRMVKSPKILKMIEAFSYDWLRVDRLNTMNTDKKLYPDFTRFVKQDMVKETYNFIYHVLNENKSVLNFIDSDFAMLNQNLAEFYGIDGVIGNDFRPVVLAREENRGGLLSQGAFLTGHSDGVHAHPIKRAVWLKEKILGDAPPPPPPNVPELDPETPGFENLTLKEQLELHRNKASCIDCHLKIDPYGVVFENYDAVGRFQNSYKGNKIDVKSKLPDGTVVQGVKGIKDYILTKKKDAFTKSLVEHLFAYALGRDVSFSDDKELNAIVEKVKLNDYKFQTVIEEIILSKSFSKRANKKDKRLAKN